ncbi:MAG: hypothetical protein JWP03_1472 [Phycisphaerales bacterium]|nr:hypothetical protein [Phycisphaerales bacterium]
MCGARSPVRVLILMTGWIAYTLVGGCVHRAGPNESAQVPKTTAHTDAQPPGADLLYKTWAALRPGSYEVLEGDVHPKDAAQFHIKLVCTLMAVGRTSVSVKCEQLFSSSDPNLAESSRSGTVELSNGQTVAPLLGREKVDAMARQLVCNTYRGNDIVFPWGSDRDWKYYLNDEVPGAIVRIDGFDPTEQPFTITLTSFRREMEDAVKH